MNFNLNFQYFNYHPVVDTKYKSEKSENDDNNGISNNNDNLNDNNIDRNAPQKRKIRH